MSMSVTADTVAKQKFVCESSCLSFVCFVCLLSCIHIMSQLQPLHAHWFSEGCRCQVAHMTSQEHALMFFRTLKKAWQRGKSVRVSCLRIRPVLESGSVGASYRVLLKPWWGTYLSTPRDPACNSFHSDGNEQMI